ncbi:MAG: TonB-dependent receptor [Bryobacterales bacterium]|nr:TonB-dependent receptor [Acidobacteriota bacterium]MCB9385455.1 TonB-dependent receptor [Bryobacterales bacterium]
MLALRAAGALLLCALAVLGQAPSGSIQGVVRDPSGAAVRASVTATLIETARQYETTTDVEGEYQLPVLPVGRYELIAQADGFAGVPRRVLLEVGRSLNVDLELTLDTIRTTVEVSDSTPLVDVGSAALGSIVSRERLRDLPLNQREFLQLALLAGGALPPAPGSELERQNDSGMHLNGAREAANNFLLDGVDNNDLYINRLVVSPPLDSVQEFRLHASNYQAEFGRSGGGQVNVVSRAGTNQLHGSFYEYLRNDAFDARNFFDPAGQPIPKFRRNQFGASAGGPLRKNRAFFFGGYEGTRIRDAITRTARVPTAQELAGDFSALGSPIFDPFTQAPFADNRIPADRISPAAQALAKAWPAPNRADPTQNLVTTPVGDGLTNQLYGRADLYASQADVLFVRYNFSHNRSLAPFGDGGSNVPGFGSFALNRGQNLVVSETHVFGPRAVLDIRFGFNRLRREIRQQNTGVDVAAALGIQGLSSDPDFVGFPAINVAGYDSIGDETALPILRQDNTYHVVGNFTLLRGAHALKMGGEVRAVTVDGIQGLFGRGQMNFLGALTTNPLSDFVLGLPTYTIQTTLDNPFRSRAQSWNGYVQDDWKLRPRLTLNLGLRYELNRPIVDADNRFSYFDFDRNELVPAGTGPLGRAGYRADRNNFAPRVGLSWNPSNGLVVRGAYGVFYDVGILEVSSGYYFNPPYFNLHLFFPSETRLLTISEPFPTNAGITPLASINAVQPDFRTAYMQQWNGGVEKTLGGGLLLRASYIGSKGTKQLRRRDLNQPAPGPGDVDARRPIPGFANVVMFESAASSSYHSGVFTLERRFGSGLTFSASYTLSKSIDDASAFLDSTGDQGFPQDSRNFRAERGLSSFDQRQRIVFAGSYALPFRNPVGRNWTIYTIASAGSGRPLTPALSIDNSNTGNSGSIFGQDRPDAIGDPNTGASTPEQWFNTAAFAIPAEYTFGNAGRNVLTGPGTASVDLAVVRRFAFGERAHLDLRAEAFNVANRTNFDLPRRYADQPTFGRILSAGAARQLQFGVRIEY